MVIAEISISTLNWNVILNLVFVILQVIHETHPWYYKSKNIGTQIGGFVKEYENIVFLTVKVSR